jgi:hypothetical protein
MSLAVLDLLLGELQAVLAVWQLGCSGLARRRMRKKNKCFNKSLLCTYDDDTLCSINPSPMCSCILILLIYKYSK